MNNKRPMNGYGYIYKYTSPSGKSYIGQTVCSLEERAGHNGKNYKGCSLFYAAIKKYGFKNFDVVVLAEVKKKELDNAEQKYIHLFNTLSPNGYNLTEGGKTGKKESRKVYQYSYPQGEFIKEWISAQEASLAYSSLPNSLENVLSGKNSSAYGFYWSYLKMKKYPVKEAMINNTKKEIRQYNLKGELIKTFPSLAQAARETFSERSAIRRCCRGELQSHNGFIWKSDEISYEKKYNNTAKKVAQINPLTKEIIQVFPSISAASKSLGKETSRIRAVLNTERKAYGYLWKTA